MSACDLLCDGVPRVPAGPVRVGADHEVAVEVAHALLAPRRVVRVPVQVPGGRGDVQLLQRVVVGVGLQPRQHRGPVAAVQGAECDLQKYL